MAKRKTFLIKNGNSSFYNEVELTDEDSLYYYTLAEVYEKSDYKEFATKEEAIKELDRRKKELG